jgi:tryptophan 2,3-dioxygenase
MQIEQLTALAGFRGFFRRVEFALGQRNTALLRDRPHGFRKGKILDLRDEAEDVSGLAAAEAVEELLAGVDVEGRGFFLVKRAEAGVVLRAGFAQANVAADDFDDVGLLFDGLGKIGHGLNSE